MNNVWPSLKFCGKRTHISHLNLERGRACHRKRFYIFQSMVHMYLNSIYFASNNNVLQHNLILEFWIILVVRSIFNLVN